MSGPRPLHQFRRGAIYAVRFRVPADLVKRLGTTELSRSLRTADPTLARRLTNEATAWFRHMMEQVRAMPDLTRADLNAAGDAYFAKLARDAMVGERFDASQVDLATPEQVGASQARIAALNDQFRALSFDPTVKLAALKIAKKAGGAFADLPLELQVQALHLAARAQREQMRMLIHSYESPGEHFLPMLPSKAWPVGDTPAPQPSTVSASPSRVAAALAMHDAAEGFLAYEKRRKVRHSHLSETTRLVGWLVEALGSTTSVVAITPDNLRDFRDGLQRLDVRHRGVTKPFADRQTADDGHQVTAQVATRYWKSACSFFSWLTDERHIVTNPSLGIRTIRPVKSVKRTPEPFTNEEIKSLLQSPLYAGHSPRSVSKPGECFERGSYWWTGMLGLFTGMRAGEIAQLEAADFDFKAEIPVIHVRVEGLEAKSLKTDASTRDIPIAAQLLELGLSEFVSGRSKGISPRMFPDVPLGQRDRKSDGMTKFWSRYLRDHGLWKAGRATHVFRHTFSRALRNAEVSEDVIGSLLGHAAVTTTARYGGGGRPMSERCEAISRIDYGVNIPAFIDVQEPPGAS